MSKKIYISPSDQTGNRYAVGNTNEAVQCRKIAEFVVTALKRCGVEALTNTKQEMSDRVIESNNWDADLHVCIHTNAFNSEVKGTRLFASDLKSTGYKVCKEIMATLAQITPGNSDGISARPGLYEIKYTNAYCAYIEVAFHDNKEEAQWIIDNTENIAEAICKGLCNYYGVTYVEKPKEPAQEPAKEILYRVQIGAYKYKENAEAQLKKAQAAGFTDAFIVEVQK